jgi:hypothetical protein
VITAVPRGDPHVLGENGDPVYQDFFSAPGRDRTCDLRFRKRLRGVRKRSSTFVKMRSEQGERDFPVRCCSPKLGPFRHEALPRRYHEGLRSLSKLSKPSSSTGVAVKVALTALPDLDRHLEPQFAKLRGAKAARVPDGVDRHHGIDHPAPTFSCGREHKAVFVYAVVGVSADQ